jgi:hypothetical protein
MKEEGAFQPFILPILLIPSQVKPLKFLQPSHAPHSLVAVEVVFQVEVVVGEAEALGKNYQFMQCFLFLQE